jgi:hypothetical protein
MRKTVPRRRRSGRPASLKWSGVVCQPIDARMSCVCVCVCDCMWQHRRRPETSNAGHAMKAHARAYEADSERNKRVLASVEFVLSHGRRLS